MDADQDSAPRLELESGTASDLFDLRVSPEYVDELAADLAAVGIRSSRGMEFSHGPALDLLVAVVQSPEFWPSVAGVALAFLRRHHKHELRIVINGREHVIKAHSPATEQKIIETLARDGHEERLEQFRRILGPSREGSAVDGSSCEATEDQDK